jgi:hypothetical protein
MRRNPGLEIRSAFGAGIDDFGGATGARASCRFKAMSAARPIGCLTPCSRRCRLTSSGWLVSIRKSPEAQPERLFSFSGNAAYHQINALCVAVHCNDALRFERGQGCGVFRFGLRRCFEH